MKKIITLLCTLVVLLGATTARAHRPDVSALALIEQSPGQWLLRVNASLTAFEYVIEDAYGPDAYASPEEFNQLVLDHLRAHITIRTNEDRVTLADGMVQLGHATTVVFKLSGVAKEVEEVFVQNEAFKSIHDSQCIFTLAPEGVDHHQVVLSEENAYRVSGLAKDNQMLLSQVPSDGYRIVIVVCLFLVVAGLVGVLLFKESRRKKAIVLPINHTTAKR